LESSSKSSPIIAKPNILVASKHCQTESSSSLQSSSDGAKVEPRVTFDLGPGSKPAAAVAAVIGGAELRRPPTEKPPSQLPSDARQRLQEMAGLDGVRRNYRKTSETFRPNQLNLTAAYAVPIGGNSATAAGVGVVGNSSSNAAAVKPPSTTAHGSAAAVAGRISPTKAYPVGAVMPTTASESANHPPPHHHNFKSSSNGGGGGGGPTTAALMRKDSRSNSSSAPNARNSLVTVQNISNNQKRPHGGAVVSSSTRDGVTIMNNASRNAINGNRTRTPSVERSIISTKDDQKDGNKVRPKSFWGGWWKF
jgi:hypothetical protein